MRRNPPAKWVLPNVINPPTSTEWCVPVPDDPYHRAAFLGALQSLGSAYKWSDDLDHKAVQVAQVWREIADNLERCMSEPETIIVEEWEDTMAICESLRWNNGVLEGFCCGEWVPIPGADGGTIPSGIGQPTGGTRPAAGESACYNVLLNANDEWQLPFNVQDGDTITVSEIEGAWSDGTINWNCAEGWPFILNTCVHSSRGHAEGDPDETDYHMQLIGNVNGVYFPATEGPYTLPGGTGVQVLRFQANDGDLSDNRGTMRFTVCVENGEAPPVSDWCYIYDFTLSDYGWEIYVAGGYDRAKYVPGQGFTHADTTWPGLIQIQSAEFADTVLTSATLTLSAPLDGPAHTLSIAVPNRFGTYFTVENNTDAVVTVPISPELSGTGIFVNIENDATENTGVPAPYLRRITLRGNGINPFGASNC